MIIKQISLCLFIFSITVLLLPSPIDSENICNETPPEIRAVDGIPAYAQCSLSTGSVYSNNGIDTRSESGGSGWIRTQWSGGYQCTEFAFRYLAFRWNIKSAPSGNAGTWGDNKLPAGLVKTNLPVHGDIIVFAPGSCGADPVTGHVAVVDIVNDSTLTIVEQNGASRRKCKLSCAKCFLHAEANNGNVAVQYPHKAKLRFDVVVLCGRDGISIFLSDFLASGASVLLFKLNGQMMADLTKQLSNKHIYFKPEAKPPETFILLVRKDEIKVYRKVSNIY